MSSIQDQDENNSSKVFNWLFSNSSYTVQILQKYNIWDDWGDFDITLNLKGEERPLPSEREAGYTKMHDEEDNYPVTQMQQEEAQTEYKDGADLDSMEILFI